VAGRRACAERGDGGKAAARAVTRNGEPRAIDVLASDAQLHFAGEPTRAAAFLDECRSFKKRKAPG
jgi:hypothetical protein